MEEDPHEEMQLLFPQYTSASSSQPPSWPLNSSTTRFLESGTTPSLDLRLSISVTPLKPPPEGHVLIRKAKCKDHHQYANTMGDPSFCVEALKWQAADQIRLAAMEKAYSERVREMTRREMDLAQSEFARARNMLERAREEVERAERMKERATQMIDMEITCHSCKHKFV